MGVLGGGCSARSLLTIELSTDDGTAVRGTPLIEVTQGDDVVRTVENDTVIILGEGSSTSVGVYLDGAVSGPVDVTATLRVTGNCRWSGSSQGSVRSGGRSKVVVKLQHMGCAGTHPDAGSHAGEGGGDDGGMTLVPDGGDGPAGTSMEACIAYCTTYVQRCVDWLPPLYGPGSCVVACRYWPPGPGAPDAHENSLACREYYLRQTANSDARNLCSVCPLASPESEACGGPPAPPRGCQGDASADTD
jgi:hypothetical protein